MSEASQAKINDSLIAINQSLQTIGFLLELQSRIAVDQLNQNVNPGAFGLRSKSFDEFKTDVLEALAANQEPPKPEAS